MNAPLATLEDKTLIRLTLAGHAECFGVLMDRHLGAVKKRISAMVRNPADADDLSQEVSLKVWRHLAQYRSEASFRTWMTRVAINETFQSLRREKRRPVCLSISDFNGLAASGESPHQSLARAEVTQVVRRAVAGLDRKHRQVLILRDLEELSARDTAQFIQSTIPAVKSRLFRARLKLSTALQQSRFQTLASAET